MKKVLIILLAVLAILLVACSTKVDDSNNSDEFDSVASFDECFVKGGNTTESFPRQCDIGDKSFTETAFSPRESCAINGGTWIEDAKECEGLSKETCEILDGTFNECASACRNDPEASVCTMQCVLVCDFNPVVTPENHVCSPEELNNQVCTRDYRPVCGDNGETYANGCTACGSAMITSWTEGEC